MDADQICGQLAKPFALFGLTVGGSTTPAIQKVFATYNNIFDYLDEEKRRLEKKRKPWKRDLLNAVEAGREKLKKYSGDTGEDKGKLYNLGTVLNPANKLTAYDGPASERRWRPFYKRQFEEFYNGAYRRAATRELGGPTVATPPQNVSLDELATLPRRRRQIAGSQAGEVAAYLHEREF